MELHLNTQTVQWITKTLKTAESECLQQIIIYVSSSIINTVQAAVHHEWEDLDHLLVQLWTSRSVRSKLKYTKPPGYDDVVAWVRDLLPELMGRGVVDLVES